MYITLAEVIQKSFSRYGNKLAYSWREDKVIHEMSYREVQKHVEETATALIAEGMKFGEHIGLIADVSHYWSISDFAIQISGGADVPRGTDSTEDELGYIVSHASCSTVFVHRADQIEKIEKGIKKYKGKVKRYIVLDSKMPPKVSKKAISFEEFKKRGAQIIAKGGKEYKELLKRRTRIKSDTLASIIYTSGTTGKPKGVMLTHGNFVSQVNLVPEPFGMNSSDRALTLLPPWHVFGRILEYFFIESGMSVYYTDVRNIGEDMKRVRPTYVPAVPRIWEGIYNKIMAGVKKGGKEKIFNFFKNISTIRFRSMKLLLDQEKLYKPRPVFIDMPAKIGAYFLVGLLLPLKLLGDLLVFRKIKAATGGALKASISGGGALPDYIDEFFAAVGIDICEGYGLTETSPVISVRHPGNIVLGTVGPPVPATELKVISMDGRDVTGIPGAKGTLHIRGPQVMKGYYKDPVKTREVLDEQGWFNTGDLVQITMSRMISIVGRSKDTIVLIGGENIEPTPIEEKLKESPFIDQVMLVGQDKKAIGALVVPNGDELEKFILSKNLPGSSFAEWAGLSEVEDFAHKEANRLISSANGFKNYEKIAKVRVLKKPFELGDELNQTFKLRRFVVSEKYAKLIEEMFR